MGLSRRQFLKGSLALSGAGALVLAGGGARVDSTTDLETVEVQIPVEDLPPEFYGYRIGFLTDLHLGIAMSADFVAQALSAVLSASIDLLLLGGDYLWIAESPLGRLMQPTRSPEFIPYRSDLKRAEAIFRTFASLLPRDPPRDGMFWVYGNHDRWIHPGIAAATIGNNRAARLLVNEQVEIERGTSSIILVGADDYLTGVPRIPPLVRMRRGPSVLLSHNPDHFGTLSERGELGLFDLALCGHTHGGQIHLPLVGAPLYNVRHQRFGEGLVREGRCAVYTSRGVGVVEFPYRIGCRPEATIVTLVGQ